jgi:hypothetical protein
MSAKTTQTKRRNPKGEPSGEGGKEQRYSEEEVAKALRSTGGLITQAAAKLGCDRATIYGYFERYPDLKKIRQEADEQVSDLAEANIMTAVRDKNLSISQWWLNQKARHRGFGDRMTHENDPDNPIPSGGGRVIIKIVRPKHSPDGNGVTVKT